jgi:hypothetical protein
MRGCINTAVYVPCRVSYQAQALRNGEKFMGPSGELPRSLRHNSDIPVALVRNHIPPRLRKDREPENGEGLFSRSVFYSSPTGVILMVYE